MLADSLGTAKARRARTVEIPSACGTARFVAEPRQLRLGACHRDVDRHVGIARGALHGDRDARPFRGASGHIERRLRCPAELLVAVAGMKVRDRHSRAEIACAVDLESWPLLYQTTSRAACHVTSRG